MKYRVLALFCLVVSTALAWTASSHSRWEQVPSKDHARINPLSGNPDAIAAGALVYRDHCAQCHQAQAQGDGHKRPSLRSSEHLRNASDGDIEWFLRQGDLAHGMPSWSSLPQLQRWQLVAFLRSLQ